MSGSFERQPSEVVRNTIVRMSQVLDTMQHAEHGDPQQLAPLLEAFNEVFRTEGVVELQVSEDGVIRIGAAAVEPTRGARSLGVVLASAGVREVVFTPGLELEHLAQLLQVVALIGSEPAGYESDLVTYWFEEGKQTIQLSRTSLSTAHLHTGKVNPLPEADSLCRLVSPALEQDPARERFLSSSAILPLIPFLPPTVSRDDHAAIEDMVNKVRDEDDDALRRQFATSVLAAMGAQTPVLSPQEVLVLSKRVIGEQILSGAYDDIVKSIRNIEFLVDERARVPEHSRLLARTVLEKVRSADMVRKLIDAMQDTGTEPPFRLVRWLLGDDPLPLWRGVAAAAQPEELRTLVVLFGTCFAFQHPFWNDAIEAMDGVKQARLKELINGLETQWRDGASSAAPPRNTAGQPRAPGESHPPNDSSSIGWDDFDFDALDEGEEANELDASLIAFLEASDSGVGRRSGDFSSDVPGSVLKHLDELEEHLAHSETMASGVGEGKGDR